MQKFMSKSEVRCASLMNNILDENINVNEILEKIKIFEQCVSFQFNILGVNVFFFFLVPSSFFYLFTFFNSVC